MSAVLSHATNSPVVELGDVADLCLGKMLDAKKNKGQLQPYLRNPNVKWLDVDLDDVRLMPFEERETERYGLMSGDVLICEGGEAGRAAIWDGRVPGMKFQKAIHRVRCRPQLHNRFLVHRLMADYFSGKLADYYTGTTIKHLTGQDLSRYRLPLPPVSEQRRIAEILDKADALRAKRRVAIAQLDTLAQSIFLDMFGDPATNPKGWPIERLEELCSVDAPLVDPTREEYRNLLHYGPDRIERDTGGLLPAKTAEEDGLISAKFLFDESAILYSKIRPNLNKVALADQRGLCSADVYPVGVRRDKVTREFLWCLLRGKHFLGYTAEVSNRANIPKINREQLLAYSAICPPLTLQREFGKRVSAAMRLKRTYQTSLVGLDALFASLQRCFFGRGMQNMQQERRRVGNPAIKHGE